MFLQKEKSVVMDRPETLIPLFLVYKNIEAQMRKKIRTILRTLSALNLGEFKNI